MTMIEKESIFAVDFGKNNVYHVNCAPVRYTEDDLVYRQSVDEDMTYLCDGCGEIIE